MLKLADRYSVTRLGGCLCQGFKLYAHPSYKNITTILKSGKINSNQPETEIPANEEAISMDLPEELITTEGNSNVRSNDH